MDDFGNTYQTDEWFYNCDQYAYSVNTFGLFDDISLDICLEYNIDYAKQII